MDVVIWIAALAILCAASIGSTLLFDWTSKKIAHREGKSGVKAALPFASRIAATISLLLLVQSCATLTPASSDAQASPDAKAWSDLKAWSNAKALPDVGAWSLIGPSSGLGIRDSSRAEQQQIAKDPTNAMPFGHFVGEPRPRGSPALLDRADGEPIQARVEQSREAKRPAAAGSESATEARTRAADNATASANEVPPVSSPVPPRNSEPRPDAAPSAAPETRSSPPGLAETPDTLLSRLPIGAGVIDAPEEVLQYQGFNVSVHLAKKKLDEMINDVKSKAPAGTTIQGIASVRLSPRMKAELIGDDLSIEDKGPQEQLVTLNEETVWTWRAYYETPGRHMLKVRLYALITIDGHEAPRIFEVADANVAVKVNPSGWALRHWEWIASALVLPLIGWGLKRRFDKK
jgi:hypothetical protein